MNATTRTIIVAQDQVLANKLRESLGRIGINVAVSQIYSHEAAMTAWDTQAATAPALTFFASTSFSTDDIATLKLLCLAAKERSKIIAVGPVQNPHIVLQLVRGGAVDCLDINNNFESELAGLIERLNATRLDSAQPGKLFTVVSPVGGAGASLLAINLAAAIANEVKTCGLLDLHLRGGDLAQLLKATPRYTLASLASKSQNLDMSMFEQALVLHKSGIRLLPSPEPYNDYRLLTPQVVQKVVQFARAVSSYVVADMEDAEHPEQARLLAASDRIIVPLRPDLVSLYHTFKLLDFLKRSNVPRDNIVLVGNRMGQAKGLPRARMAEVLETPIHYDIPDDPAGVNASFNLGIPLVTYAPHGKSSKCFYRLANALRGVNESAHLRADAPAWLARFGRFRCFSHQGATPETVASN